MQSRAVIGLGLATLAAAVSAMAADTASGPPAPPDTQSAALETVVVTGSRIRRTAVEGPAPVTVISAEDIRDNGYATVSDVMAALTQNLGALDNNQNTDGFSPGAQAVDLRGLGPNHSLVLVNGRRVNSCLRFAIMHDGDEITTIEGLAQGEQLHPVQAAFIKYDGFQCGYCTPGQICSAV